VHDNFKIRELKLFAYALSWMSIILLHYPISLSNFTIINLVDPDVVQEFNPVKDLVKLLYCSQRYLWKYQQGKTGRGRTEVGNLGGTYGHFVALMGASRFTDDK